MALITFPTLTRLRAVSLEPIIPQQVNRSPFTGRSKVIGLPGAELWTGAVETGEITTERQWREWRAFLAACEGQANWFAVPALPALTRANVRPSGQMPVGYTPANAVTITVTNTPARNTGTFGGAGAAGLAAGMYFSMDIGDGHRRFYIISTLNVGTGAVKFWPPVHGSLTALPVTVAVDPYFPKGNFRLADPRWKLPEVIGAGSLVIPIEEPL